MPDVAPNGDPRVFLAIERTFLAWTRTALALMGFGFVVARLGLFLREMAVAQMQPTAAMPTSSSGLSGSVVLGCALIVAGVSVQASSMLEHRRRVRRFHSGQPIAPMRDSVAMILGICIITAGIAGALYLLSRAAT